MRWIEKHGTYALVTSAVLALGGGLVGCKKKDVSGLSLSSEKLPDGPLEVAVPEGGPTLHVLKSGAVVLDRPGPNGKVLGELAAGAVLTRSERPYGRASCKEGYYAVRPRGFVCAGPTGEAGPTYASLAAPDGVTFPAPAERHKPLPYRYGRARVEGVPLYAKVPSPSEQLAIEADLSRWLAKAGLDKEVLGAAANDVPLDERGLAKGPAMLVPSQEGVGRDGRRTSASFFELASDARPPTSSLVQASGGSLEPTLLGKGREVAFGSSFLAPGPAGPRRFVVLADGRVAPADRLKPALGSTWSGLDLAKTGLPAAFVHKLGVHTWSLAKGKAVKNDDELERHTSLALSGKFRTVDGVRFEETRDGRWLRAKDLVVIMRRSKFPDFATGSQKWMDVSIANQTLTLYEGRKPVYATLVSTGRDMLRDPSTSASTPRGNFKVRKKWLTQAVDGREAQGDRPLLDAPWVMELEAGLALTGQVWSDSVGEAHGFRNVALTPIDARKVFTWSDPVVPEGWHGVVDEAGGTIVSIRP
jgi:hypothetical protein